MESIDSIETYVYKMNINIVCRGGSRTAATLKIKCSILNVVAVLGPPLVCKKEEIRFNSIIKQYKNVYLWLYCKRKQKRP